MGESGHSTAPLVMEINIIFVRHGETEANVGAIIDGVFNLPLTDVGRRQAAAIAEANLHFNGDVVKTETLRERSFGCLEGKNWKEFASHPKHDGWPGTFTPDGGETWTM